MRTSSVRPNMFVRAIKFLSRNKNSNIAAVKALARNGSKILEIVMEDI